MPLLLGPSTSASAAAITVALGKRILGFFSRLCRIIADKAGEHRFAYRHERPFIQQDIGRFDVAVDYTFLMSVVNCTTDTLKEVNDIARRRKFSSLSHVADIDIQSCSFKIVHNQVASDALWLWRTSDVDIKD